jgi:hypothetical protein
MERGGMGNDGHGVGVPISRETPGSVDYGEQIVGFEVLCSEDPIHGFEGKLATAVQEVGEMGLAKAGLASQQRDAERPPLYPSEQLKA